MVERFNASILHNDLPVDAKVMAVDPIMGKKKKKNSLHDTKDLTQSSTEHLAAHTCFTMAQALLSAATMHHLN